MVTLIKAPQQYIVHAGDDEYTLTVRLHKLHRFFSQLAQAYLLFLGRGASSRALFDVVACLTVSVQAVLSGYMYVVRTLVAPRRQKHGGQSTCIFKHLSSIAHK